MQKSRQQELFVIGQFVPRQLEDLQAVIKRVAFGMILIVAFSVGLALMLTGIGVALAAGAPLLTRLPWRDKLPSGLRLARVISVGAALVIAIAGIVLTAEAVPALL